MIRDLFSFNRNGNPFLNFIPVLICEIGTILLKKYIGEGNVKSKYQYMERQNTEINLKNINLNKFKIKKMMKQCMTCMHQTVKINLKLLFTSVYNCC